MNDENPTPMSLGATFLKMLKERRRMLLISFLVAACCVFLLHRGALPVVPKSRIVELIAPTARLQFFLLSVAVLSARAYRFHFLYQTLGKIPLRRLLAVQYLFFAALFVLPVRLGEAVRPFLLRQKDQDGADLVTPWQVGGIVVAERIMDGLMASLILVSALFADDIFEGTDRVAGAAAVRPAALALTCFFLLGLFTISLFYFARSRAIWLIERTLGLISRPLARWLNHIFVQLASGLSILAQPKQAVKFVLSSMLYWGINLYSIHLLLAASGLELTSLAPAAAVIGTFALGLMVPSAPGFFGTFQMSVYAGLSLFFGKEVVEAEGASVVFWMYVIQSITILSMGLLAWVSLPFLSKKER